MGVQLGYILDTKPIIRNALICLAMRKFIIVVRSEDGAILKLAERYFRTPDKTNRI